MSLEEDLTVLVDYEKYPHPIVRIKRQTTNNTVSTSRDGYDGELSDNCEPNCSEQITPQNICADPDREVYQECGNKCVLACRYTSSSSSSPSISFGKHECEKNDCVEGCFCKTGAIKYENII